MADHPLIPNGCILIARKLVESEIWEKPPLYLKVWLYLLIHAQHKNYKGLKRGQLLTSIPDIIEAVAWRVGARMERPTKDQIFQVLDWMRNPMGVKSPKNGENESITEINATPSRKQRESNAKATMITTTKATQSMLINIDSYGFHQNIKNYESNGVSNGENLTKPSRKQREADNINKNVKNDKNVQEKELKEYPENTVALTNHLIKCMKLNNPKAKIPANLEKWNAEMDRLERIDLYDHTQILKIIDWCQADPFWKANILSASKLREKIGTIFLQMQRPTGGERNGEYGKRLEVDLSNSRTEQTKTPKQYGRIGKKV